LDLVGELGEERGDLVELIAVGFGMPDQADPGR